MPHPPVQGTEYVMFPGFSAIYAGLNGVGHELTPQEWAASGYQTPVVTEHETFKLSWTPEIASYDVDAEGVVATVLTYEDWVALGAPQPWVMPTLPGDEVCTVPGSPDLVYSGATFEGVLTFGQWQAAGFPAPTCVVEPA